jgi:hypothetical protein
MVLPPPKDKPILEKKEAAHHRFRLSKEELLVSLGFICLPV